MQRNSLYLNKYVDWNGVGGLEEGRWPGGGERSGQSGVDEEVSSSESLALNIFEGLLFLEI